MTVTLAALADADVLTSALGRVVRNGGAPGVDGVSTSSLAGQWSEELPRVQAEICTASYSPRPLRVLEVPKPDGGLRILGIPVVRDRVVLEALRRLIAPAWEPTFSPLSFAYRPGRSAQDAIAATQRFMGDGRSWIVDLDIEKFFDHVDHVRLMLRLGQRIADPGILDLIADFLRCGRLWPNGCHEATREGIAQGSPLSPLLADRKSVV